MKQFCQHIRFSSVTWVSALCLAAVPALASGGEGAAAGHHPPHVANWWGLGSEHAGAPALGWLGLTWLLFMGVLVSWVRKPLRAYLETRSSEVRKALEEAQAAKAEAEARAAASEARLSQLDADIAALKDEFRAQGEAEMARLEEAAKASAERIAKDAQGTIEAEMEKAREVLKAEGAKLALELAEESVRGAAGAADHQRLYQSFLSDLSA